MRYQRFENFYNHDIGGIQFIPYHWKVIKLKYLIIQGRDGIKIGPFGSSLRMEELSYNGEYKVYGQENLIADNFKIGKRYLDEEKFRELQNYEIFPGDVLVSMMGTTGKFLLVPFSIQKGIMDSHLLRLRFTNNVYERFFYYTANFSTYIRDQLNVKGKGSIMLGLNSSIVKGIELILPPLPEQQSIANFLDRETARIDALIEKKQKLIDLLKEKRTALITKAVTKGLNSDVKMKDSGIDWLGEIPEHWEVKKLKYFSTINDESLNDKTDPSYEMKYVDIGSIDPDYGIVKKEDMIFENAPSRARRIVKNGDTIVSTVRTYLKAIAPVVNPERNLIVSTGFAVVRPQNVFARFLSYALRSLYFIDKVVSMSDGVSYPAINSGTLSTIKLPIPNDTEDQKAIVEFLDKELSKLSSLIDKAELGIIKHKEYRTALISAAVTGKIKVTDE